MKNDGKNKTLEKFPISNQKNVLSLILTFCYQMNADSIISTMCVIQTGTVRDKTENLG
jgi:hypothetical protein